MCDRYARRSDRIVVEKTSPRVGYRVVLDGFKVTGPYRSIGAPDADGWRYADADARYDEAWHGICVFRKREQAEAYMADLDLPHYATGKARGLYVREVEFWGYPVKRAWILVGVPGLNEREIKIYLAYAIRERKEV